MQPSNSNGRWYVYASRPAGFFSVMNLATEEEAIAWKDEYNAADPESEVEGIHLIVGQETSYRVA